MTFMKSILRQPLIHFLAIGLLFFLLHRWAADGVEDPRIIIVDKDALMTHFQYRSKAFNQDVFEERLAGMSDVDLKQLIDEYVREEVLYREAMAMGLDKEDYIIKRRMIQKLEFISEGIAEAVTELSEEEITAYYEENKEDYYIQPFVTFTHVFVKDGKKVKEKAEEELRYLNRNGIPFSQAMSRGDRFLYHTNYVEREPEYVASHFGIPMTKAIFDANPSDSEWIGPFESDYGFHLVMVTKNEPGKYPDLADIQDRVAEDAQRELIIRKNEEAISGIIEEYEVVVEYEK